MSRVVDLYRELSLKNIVSSSIIIVWLECRRGVKHLNNNYNIA